MLLGSLFPFLFFFPLIKRSACFSSDRESCLLCLCVCILSIHPTKSPRSPSTPLLFFFSPVLISFFFFFPRILKYDFDFKHDL